MTPWTVACQPSLSMEFSRQEYWSGLLCPPLGDLTDPGIQPTSLTSSALGGGSLPLAPSGKPHTMPNTVHVLSAEPASHGAHHCHEDHTQSHWTLFRRTIQRHSNVPLIHGSFLLLRYPTFNAHFPFLMLSIYTSSRGWRTVYSMTLGGRQGSSTQREAKGSRTCFPGPLRCCLHLRF